MGPIDYLYMSNFKKLHVPIIAMFTGPIYKVSDITRLGVNEIISNFNSLSVQLLYASLPSFFSKKLVNSNSISRVFVMSRKNREMLVGMGADSTKIVHVPVGIDEYDLILPESYESVISKFNVSPGSFNILYFGSPLKIRGIDSLIKAISKVAESHPDVKLLILSRRREKELSQEERNVFDLIEELDLKNNVQIVSGFLEREDVKRFIKFCDVVCLPFKLVPSDVPTSILESMAMGKIVISTNVDGIPELLEDGRGFAVEPNDENELANKIISCLNDIDSLKEAEKRLLDHMQKYPRWNDIAETVNQELDSVVSRGVLP
jgi:glycosyltransferase involved in cell wall biosynthesis